MARWILRLHPFLRTTRGCRRKGSFSLRIAAILSSSRFIHRRHRMDVGLQWIQVMSPEMAEQILFSLIFPEVLQKSYLRLKPFLPRVRICCCLKIEVIKSNRIKNPMGHKPDYIFGSTQFKSDSYVGF